MFSLTEDSAIRNIVYALLLELIFLGFSGVFIGLGISEISKGKPKFENGILALFGISIGLISLYVTFIFIKS